MGQYSSIPLTMHTGGAIPQQNDIKNKIYLFMYYEYVL